jgi:hypothetical protein
VRRTATRHVANGHMSPAPAPALSRSLGLRRQPARRSRRVRVDLVVDRVEDLRSRISARSTLFTARSFGNALAQQRRELSAQPRIPQSMRPAGYVAAERMTLKDLKQIRR